MSKFAAVVRLANKLPKGSQERQTTLKLAGKMKSRLMDAWAALVEMVPSLPMELGDSYTESLAIADVMKAYPREYSTSELYDVLDYMRRQPKHMRRVADKLDIDKAIKRPGRLHKYFGIPEDENIPMAKIDAEIKKLKDKEDKSKEEDSLLAALYLGKRLKKMGSMTDRQNLIRLTADLPKGSAERRAILAGLKRASRHSSAYFGYNDRVSNPPKVMVNAYSERSVDYVTSYQQGGVAASSLVAELKTEVEILESQLTGFREALEVWAKGNNFKPYSGGKVGVVATGDVTDLTVSDRAYRTWLAPDLGNLPLPQRERREEVLGKEFKALARKFGFGDIDTF